MSDPGFKPPAAAAGSNPPLGTKAGAGDNASSPHRLPGGFVPPPDALPRGLPKAGVSARGVATRQGSKRVLLLVLGSGTLAAAIAGGIWLGARAPSAPVATPLQTSQSALPQAGLAVQGGEASLPDWVPTYPSGSQTALTSNLVAGEPQGTLQYKTTSSPREVADYYKEKLAAKGLVITAFTTTGGTGVVEAKSTDGEKKVIVMTESSPQGATASIVFTTLDPDKSVPLPGGALPAFAPQFPGSELTEQVTRARNGMVFGFMKLKVQAALATVLDFYQPKFEAAHYQVERIEQPGFGRLSGTSLKDAAPVALFVEEANGTLTVTVKVDPKE